jgi:type I restriction enzyme R subunit
MIIEELTRTGVMEPSRLFESPYCDIAPTGIQSLFGQSGGELTRILESLKTKATEILEDA